MTALVENAIDDRTLEVIGQLILPSGACMSDTFESDPWQVAEVIGPTLAKRADGLPANRYVVDVEPKGSGKSTRGAARPVTECVLEPATHCYVVAVDAEQL